MTLPSYSTGTASIDNGGTTVTITGGILTGNAFEGDFIVFDDVFGGFIVEVTDATSAELPEWAGSAQTDVPYKIYATSSRRFSDVQIADDLRKQVQALNASGYFVLVPSGATEPDASLGDDDQYALQPSTGAYWLKTGGLWVASGGPVKGYGGTSTTSLALSVALKSLTTQSTLAYQVGSRVRLSNDSTHYMEGPVTDYDATTGEMEVDVDYVVGSGTFTAWNLSVAGDPGDVDLSGDNSWSGSNDFAHSIKPTSNDGAALGSSSLKWSDLFLASGAVINFNSGDVTITHSSNEIAVAGGRLRLGSTAAEALGGTFQTSGLMIAETSASFLMKATAAAADNKMMDISLASVGIFAARFLDDAFNTGTSIFQASRSGNDVAQYSIFGGAGVEQFRITPSHAYFPEIGTTASAANAFLNSGSSPANELLRSTSSLAYKRDVEPLEQQYADRVLDLDPIWYRSKASNDNPDWSWYGLGAEDVAAIDPRLVQWGYQDDDFDMVERERVETIQRQVETTIDGKTVIETVPHEIKTVTKERVLKEGAELKPDGVMYERVAVLLLDVVKRLEARVSELECGA